MIPPEQTVAGCDAVALQFIVLSPALLKFVGMLMTNVTVLLVALPTAANLPLEKSPAVEVYYAIVP